MSMKDAVRLATIDNYQGEENEIIILSLVRSNKDKQVGFVRLQNRTNVMLSRAKQGLYIIGNADCMASGRHPGIWPRVVSMFEEDDLLGPAFHLVCQKHPLDVTAVSTPRDFDTRVSDGGCSRNCTERLQPCGHACPRLCHSDDPLHRLTKCHKPCNKPQPCGHPCRYKCYEKCGSCTVLLRDVPLPCGHVMPSLECWRARQVEAVRCERPVEVCMPHCGHVIAVPCADAQAAQNKPWMCSHACNALLPCEHPCTSSCGRCLEGWAAHELGFRSPAVPASLETEQRGSTLTVRLPSGDRVLRLPPPAEWLHRKCTGACGRTLFCGHRCEGRCHQGSECPPCRKPCGVQCMHSKCGKACGDLCPPCAEPCPWDCPHQGLCPLPCGAPCVRLPCDKRCSRRLACGCLCPSVCGEPCPDPRFCPNHGLPDIMVYDPIMCEERCVVELGQEELDADPLICLPCGHAFPVSSMDEQMELQAKKRSLEGGGEEVRGAYTRRPDGSWAAPFPLQESLSQASTCMKCRAPVGGVRRYGRLLGKQGVDAAEIKFLKQSSVALEGLGRRLDGLSRSAAAAAASEGGGGGERQRQLHGLQKDGRELLERCKALVKEVSQPPTILLYDAARATVLRLAEEQRLPQGRTEEALRHLVMPRPDVTPALRAVLMRTRCCVELLQLGAAELEALKAELVRAGKAPARPMGPQAGRGGSRQGSSRPAEQRVSELAGSLTRLFSGGLKGAEYAQQLAEERGSFRYQVACCRALAQLLMARAMALAALDSTAMAEALRKEPSAHRSATQQAKHVTLDKAEEVLADAQRLVRTHPAAAEDPDQMAEQMEGLSGLLRRVRQLRDTGELSEEDKALIVRAMVQADPSLANPGLNRTGHFNRCSCGFIYVIGECGGAMQAMRCPECRRTIGGANHNLQEGNAPAIDFFQLAQQQQRNM